MILLIFLRATRQEYKGERRSPADFMFHYSNKKGKARVSDTYVLKQYLSDINVTFPFDIRL